MTLSYSTPSRISALLDAPAPWADVISEAVPQSHLSVYGNLTKLSKADIPDDFDTMTDLPDLILGGYGSPQVVDQQKHLITKEALGRDLPRFLAVPEYRNANLLHTNIQVAVVLPSWTDPVTNETYRTKVDDIGLFVVVKVRTDKHRQPVLDEVIRDIKSGKLAAFSISADAPFDARRYVCKDGTCFFIIDRVYLYEVTLCARPVNQDALATILSKSYNTLTLADEYLPSSFCADGTCKLPTSTINNALDTELTSKYLTLIKDVQPTGVGRGLPNAWQNPPPWEIPPTRRKLHSPKLESAILNNEEDDDK